MRRLPNIVTNDTLIVLEYQAEITSLDRDLYSSMQCIRLIVLSTFSCSYDALLQLGPSCIMYSPYRTCPVQLIDSFHNNMSRDTVTSFYFVFLFQFKSRARSNETNTQDKGGVLSYFIVPRKCIHLVEYRPLPV
jgi:hypothetical protein